MQRQPTTRVIGFCSAVWQEVASRRLEGVLGYAEEQEDALAVRDFRYQEYIADVGHGPPPPWTGLAHGVIVCFGVDGDVNEMAAWLARGGVPVISLVREWNHRQVPIVDTDSAAVMKMAAKYFVDHGYKRCLYVGNGLSPADTAARREQFNRVVTAQGATPRGYDLTFYPTGGTEDLDHLLCEKELIELLKSSPKPLAVFGQSDYYARAISLLCERMQLDMPRDVAILGSGNFLTSRCHVPAISTVQTANERIGYEAARQLHLLMQEKPIPGRTTLLKPLRIIERQSTAAAVKPKDDIQAACEYIRDHACEGMSVDDVVRLLSVSRRTLETKFAERLGQTPKQMIQQVRLERARHLLLKTQLSITQVALMTGFSEVSALTNFIRKETGVSPSQLRARTEKVAQR